MIWPFMLCSQVLPDDMVVLAEPDPGDMVQAIKKAITILPTIDPQEMHNRVSEFFEEKLTKCFSRNVCNMFMYSLCSLSI